MVFVAMAFVPVATKSASAANVILGPDFVIPLANYIGEFSQFKSREPGSMGEADAAAYIKAELDQIAQTDSRISAVNNSSTVDGVQTFSFVSAIDGLKKTSQNIIYKVEAAVETDKKLIIACNYDNIAYKINDNYELELVESEGISGSAASVAVALLLADCVPSGLNYDIEFIFFGAGNSNMAGSKFYASGILPETQENILAMINIDNVGVGENLYFYVDEFETDFARKIEEEIRIAAKKVNTIHLGKVLVEGDELGLGYSHVAMDSDNKTFMKQGILSINFFAGDYEEGIVYGRSEFGGKDNVIFTENDNTAYIKENYCENASTYEFVDNAHMVLRSIMGLMFYDEFENLCMAAKGQTDVYYDVFANQNLIAYLSVVALFVMFVISSYIYFKLTVKSYEANIEPEFLSTVISISEHIDEEGKDENVPKAVSQVIAMDIRKNKTIKSKKNKKDS